jgi:hypothetical protein
MSMKLFVQCNHKEKIERWQNVLRVLRRLTPHQRRKHFNMAIFLDKTDCGTVGCAAGFCALDTWFRRRGFSARLDRNGLLEIGESADIHGFFGPHGSSSIFHNLMRRPVGVVIGEVKALIKELRSEV